MQLNASDIIYVPCVLDLIEISINPETSEIYGIDFPDIAVKDTVKIQLEMLKEHLNIRSVKCVIGGSFGGMVC